MPAEKIEELSPGGPAKTDGVVITYTEFGITDFPPFDKGRTATHEIGHWLNLYHIWGVLGLDARVRMGLMTHQIRRDLTMAVRSFHMSVATVGQIGICS
jgi:hypothetical protein